MLAFVTTIRHPTNSSSFARVGRLLDATLRSVCRQSDESFRVIIVHNVMPTVEYHNPRISDIQVDFPAPSSSRTARIDFSLFRRDRGTKSVIGAIAARELGADHVMFFDADDFLHKELASHANASPRHAGWYSPQGFIHTMGFRTVQFVPDEFHRKNGSTGIVRSDLLHIPDRLTTSSSQEEMLAAMGDQLVLRIYGEHGWWPEYLEPEGYRLTPLPFPAAIWNIGTGENHSGNVISGRSSQRIDQHIVDTFGLQQPSVLTHISAKVKTTIQRGIRLLPMPRVATGG